MHEVKLSVDRASRVARMLASLEKFPPDFMARREQGDEQARPGLDALVEADRSACPG